MRSTIARLLRRPWPSSTTRPALGRVAWLTLVWVLLWGTFSPANLLGGLAVALVVLWLFPLPHVVGHHRLRPGGLLRAAAAVAADLVGSSLRVAVASLRPGPPVRSSIVEVRIEGSELLLAVAVEALSLVPGSVVIESSPEDGLLHAHVLGADDDAAVEDFRREVTRLERRLAAAGFGPVAVETAPAEEGP